jgi:hypothetical protein
MQDQCTVHRPGDSGHGSMPGMHAPLLAHNSPAEALDYLRWHWGEAYEVTRLGPRWTARRRDTGKLLRATDPDELLSLIRAESPVTRDRAC